MAKNQSVVNNLQQGPGTKPQSVVDRILDAEPSGRVFVNLSVRSDLRGLFEEARKLTKTQEDGWFFQGTYGYVKNQEAEVVMSTVSVGEFGDENPELEEIEVRITDSPKGT